MMSKQTIYKIHEIFVNTISDVTIKRPKISKYFSIGEKAQKALKDSVWNFFSKVDFKEFVIFSCSFFIILLKKDA